MIKCFWIGIPWIQVYLINIVLFRRSRIHCFNCVWFVFCLIMCRGGLRKKMLLKYSFFICHVGTLSMTMQFYFCICTKTSFFSFYNWFFECTNVLAVSINIYLKLRGPYVIGLQSLLYCNCMVLCGNIDLVWRIQECKLLHWYSWTNCRISLVRILLSTKIFQEISFQK